MCNFKYIPCKALTPLVFVLAGLCFLLANVVNGVTVTYTFSDTFDEYAFDSSFSPVFSPGGTISGSITFDTTATNPLGNPVSFDITSSIPDVDSSPGTTTPESTFYDSTLTYHSLNNVSGSGAKIASRTAPGAFK